MNIVFRAIATGFGLKIGSELGKFITEKVRTFAGLDDESDSEGGSESSDKDDDLPGSSPEPPAV